LVHITLNASKSTLSKQSWQRNDNYLCEYRLIGPKLCGCFRRLLAGPGQSGISLRWHVR
jgi:hypothetical protein